MPSWKKVITSGSNASLNSLYLSNSITASAIYSSGSNQLGDATNDTQTLIGTTRISGSLAVTGSTYLPNLSYAVKNRIVVQDSTTGLLSYQSPADLTVFPYTGSAIVSGSLTTIGTQQVSGSLGVTGSVYIGSTAVNNILITTAAGSSYFANDAITVQGPSFGPADAEIILHNNTTDVIGPRIDMARSYANNNLSAGNDMGELRFWRAYGNLSFTQGAYIKATAISGSTVASGPAALYFGTTPSGSITPQQRLVIQENGNVGIGAPTASATLHVSGASIIFDIPSKANGYVLSSNASGNATWVQPATLAVFPYTGSAIISGSLTVTGSVVATSFTGSLQGTASWAVTSSHALTASYVNPLRQNVTITGSLFVTQSYISKVDWIDFTSASDQPVAAARLGWNDSDGTLSLGLKGGNVDLLIGEAEFAYVYNAEATTLTKGTVVYISGSQGNRIAVKRAAATDDANSAGTLGFVAETITAGTTGIVITNGVFPKLDTSGLTAGALLFLSSSAGEYSTTAPQAPLHAVRLGYVERVSATVGSIFVKVDNGYELGELHDVVDTTTTASYGDLLVKSGSVWINSKQLTGSYGLTGSLTISGSLTTNDGVNIQTLTASVVSASSGITGSLFGTASWAQNAITSSYVTTLRAAGSNTLIQYNSASILEADNDFSYDYTLHSLNQGSGNSTVGLYSHAQGANVTAFGTGSHAEGSDTAANGNYSHAEGQSSTAQGEYSHAEGNAGAYGTGSHAEGAGTANGDYSHAEGGATANGDYSHAEGDSTISSGIASHAEGYSATSSGFASHAEGYSTLSPGSGSHAEGDSTTTYGDQSHAEGIGNYTGQLGYNSTSITAGVISLDSGYGDVKPYIDGLTGYIILDDREYDNLYGCQLYEISSITAGTPTVIYLVDTSVATTQAKIGVPGVAQPSAADVVLKGNSAHAEGADTIATGNASHAAGLYANTIGYASYAGGSNTVAYRQYQTVVGKFNKLDRVNINEYDYSFVVGNGTSVSVRDNIFSVQPEVSTIQISSSYLNINGLPSDNTISNILTIDTGDGRVYITTGSVFGGGGSTSTTKAGSGSAASFGGSPRTSTITFGSAFSDNLYAVTVTGEDARTWTIESKSASSFVINSNSSVALTGPVYWIATPFNS